MTMLVGRRRKALRRRRMASEQGSRCVEVMGAVSQCHAKGEGNADVGNLTRSIVTPQA